MRHFPPLLNSCVFAGSEIGGRGWKACSDSFHGCYFQAAICNIHGWSMLPLSFSMKTFLSWLILPVTVACFICWFSSEICYCLHVKICLILIREDCEYKLGWLTLLNCFYKFICFIYFVWFFLTSKQVFFFQLIWSVWDCVSKALWRGSVQEQIWSSQWVGCYNLGPMFICPSSSLAPNQFLSFLPSRSLSLSLCPSLPPSSLS